MDEVGRGTTVHDGLAIAFAAIHHLLFKNGCRAMFATHFHELADMLGYDCTNHHGHGAFSNVAFYCTNVDELKVRIYSKTIPSRSVLMTSVGWLLCIRPPAAPWGEPG